MTQDKRERHNARRRHNRRLQAALVRYASDVLGDAAQAAWLAAATPSQAKAWAAERGITTPTTTR